MKHYIPVSATFSLFKYINISPQISINDRMYTSKIRRQWDTQASREVQDTTYGFYNLFDFNASVSLDTKVYGFYKPWKVFGDKVQMIRHVITPTVSFSGALISALPAGACSGLIPIRMRRGKAHQPLQLFLPRSAGFPFVGRPQARSAYRSPTTLR